MCYIYCLLPVAAGNVGDWGIWETSTSEMNARDTTAETRMNREQAIMCCTILPTQWLTEAKGIKITTLPGSSTTLKQSREVLPGVDECVCSACVWDRDTVKCKVRLYAPILGGLCILYVGQMKTQTMAILKLSLLDADGRRCMSLPDCNLLCSITLDCSRPHKMCFFTPKVNADPNFPLMEVQFFLTFSFLIACKV